jgi:hypothetical protein
MVANHGDYASDDSWDPRYHPKFRSLTQKKTADPKVVVAPTHVRDDVGEVVGAGM